LAANGYKVFLIVADGLGDEITDGVDILDVGSSRGRLDRILRASLRILRRAKNVNGDIYHIHDPELIPIGLWLQAIGKKVLFDAHEDVPKQLLSKPYLGPIRLRVLAVIFSVFERFALARFSGIIAATPSIREKFLSINLRTIGINNYPLLDELNAGTDWCDKAAEICYVGGIGSIRGIREVILAMASIRSKVRLNLVGAFWESDVEEGVKALPGWRHTNELGFMDRSAVRDVLGRSVAGLVTFHPLPNHIAAQPNKMFEYMSAGLPVIASHFPLWREIIEGNDCGVCVDPMDPEAIAVAIDELTRDTKKAESLGTNGRRAVLEKYNWPVEEKKLLCFYSQIIRNSFK